MYSTNYYQQEQEAVSDGLLNGHVRWLILRWPTMPELLAHHVLPIVS
jgi:hypothetical protein